MYTYWQKQAFGRSDTVIIGAGITGLSTAISLKAREPNREITVLERGIFPMGASVRNAGFACIGSFTEIRDDLAMMGETKTLALVAMRLRGLNLLRKRLGDVKIGYRENGSYELLDVLSAPRVDDLDEMNALLRPVLGADAYSVVPPEAGRFGLDPEAARVLLRNHVEGELDTGLMMRALLDLAQERGIIIRNGSEVIRLESNSQGVTLELMGPGKNEIFGLRAARLAICTNGYATSLLPELPVRPGRGQVLLTDPIPGLQIRGIFHFDRGYYYFREIDGRVLFGGGRQLDPETETTAEEGPNPLILDDLARKLKQVILPGIPHSIAQQWSGIMAFGPEKSPLILQVAPHLYAGVRLGGMGIAIGSAVGEQLAALMAEQQ